MRFCKLFAFLASVLFSAPVMADDDTMITRDGNMTPVKVERISSSQVVFVDLKHKKSGSQSLPTDFVYMIIREKGNNIFFDEEGNQMTSPAVKFEKKDNVLLLNKGELLVVYNLSVSKDELKYQLKDKKKEPWVTVKKSEVFMLLNSDGTTTLFNESYQEKQNAKFQESATSAVNTSIVAESVNKGNTRSNVVGRYKIGSLFNENGLKGIVVYVDNTGQHGLIMSLEANGSRWSKGGDLKTETECFDKNDGQKNFEAIEHYINETGSSWEIFPVFEWAKNLGEGWYIPANAELELIAKAVNGGSMTYNEKVVNEFGKKIKSAGGDQLINKGFGHDDEFKTMFSSTEIEGGSVYQLVLAKTRGSAIGSAVFGKFSKKKGELTLKPTVKNLGNIGLKLIGSRAVHKF